MADGNSNDFGHAPDMPDEIVRIARTTSELRAANQRWREMMTAFCKEVVDKAALRG